MIVVNQIQDTHEVEEETRDYQTKDAFEIGIWVNEIVQKIIPTCKVGFLKFLSFVIVTYFCFVNKTKLDHQNPLSTRASL